jgi:hypothetical protein
LPLASPLISATALIFAFFYFYVPRQERRTHDDLVSVVNSQFDAKLKERHVDEMQADVGKLQGQMATMLPFLQMVVQKEMKTLASLPITDFQNSLARVNVAFAAAKSTKADIPSSTIGDLRSKLVQVSKSTPYYWGTATALIGYRSIQLPNNLPNCFDKDPVMTTLQAIPKHITYPFDLKITPPTYQHCKVDLSQSPPQNVIDYLKIAPKLGVEFKESIIVYRAGMIPLLNLAPRLVFTNCAFQISPGDTGNEPGRKLVNDLLLAQNQAAVTIAGNAGE